MNKPDVLKTQNEFEAAYGRKNNDLLKRTSLLSPIRKEVDKRRGEKADCKALGTFLKSKVCRAPTKDVTDSE